jgi:hypothetical protein
MEKSPFKESVIPLTVTSTGIVIGGAYEGPLSPTYEDLWLKELLSSSSEPRSFLFLEVCKLLIKALK